MASLPEDMIVELNPQIPVVEVKNRKCFESLYGDIHARFTKWLSGHKSVPKPEIAALRIKHQLIADLRVLKGQNQ